MGVEKTETNIKDYYVVDLSHIVKVVWHRIWLVGIVGLLLAIIGFTIAAFSITPTYSSSVMLYVNNGSFNVGDLGFSISSSQLTAAQSLTKTYTVLLKNRTTLERIIDETDVKYTWEELHDMIWAGSVNETEVIRVTVTSTNPYEAAKIANGIATILPQRVSEVVEGASMEVVDSAIANTEKVAPSVVNYTLIGFVIGVLIAVIILIILAVMDNTIHDEDYVIKTYDYPVLAKIPDLLESNTKRYGYYYKRHTSKGEK